MEKNLNIRTMAISLLLIISIVLLYILNGFNINLLILLSSLVLFILYSIYNEKILLIGSILGFIIANINMINRYLLISMDIRQFSYLFLLGSLSLYLFISQRRQGIHLILSGVFYSLSIFDFLRKFLDMNMYWLAFILISFVFYLAYITSYKENGIVWPKYISYIMLGIGVVLSVFFISHFDRLGFKVIVPIMVTIIGIYIFKKNMEKLGVEE